VSRTLGTGDGEILDGFTEKCYTSASLEMMQSDAARAQRGGVFFLDDFVGACPDYGRRPVTRGWFTFPVLPNVGV
jgi:hypothetical protein